MKINPSNLTKLGEFLKAVLSDGVCTNDVFLNGWQKEVNGNDPAASRVFSKDGRDLIQEVSNILLKNESLRTIRIDIEANIVKYKPQQSNFAQTTHSSIQLNTIKPATYNSQNNSHKLVQSSICTGQRDNSTQKIRTTEQKIECNQGTYRLSSDQKNQSRIFG